MPSRRARAAAALLVSCVLVAPAARAEDATAAASIAEALFAEGRALLEKGDAAGACAKFQESLKLDPEATGTVLNLALCSERAGRLATAWVRYREVIARSRGTRADRVRLAEERAAAIEPRLSRLRVDVPPAAKAEGLAVALDGAALGESVWGASLPVDGGEHVVRASAPGKIARETRVDVRAESDAREVVVAPLEDAPATRAAPPRPPAAPPPGPTPATATPRSSARAAGFALSAAGIATTAIGATFGVAALASRRPSDLCNVGCTPNQQSAADAQYRRLDAYGWIADVALPVGLVMIGVGAYVVLHDAPGGARIAVTPRGALLDAAF